MEWSREIDRATSYCTYCPKMCRFSCPAAEAEKRETVTPWGMMRLFEMVKDGSVAPSDEVAETFYHCMGCRRCQTWCHHDNDVPEALWEARKWMRELGHVPEPLEGYETAFLENNSPHESLPALEHAADREIEDVFDPESSVVYMPDCETRHERPDMVVRAGLLLEIFHGSPVALATRHRGEGEACCGFPLLAAGEGRGYNDYRSQLERRFGEADTIVAECPAMVALYDDDSSWGESGELEIVSLVTFLVDRLPFVQTREPVSAEHLMIHDACMTGRQLELYDEIRTLVDALCDDAPDEFQYSREEAPCCGGAAHYPEIAPSASERCANSRLEQMEREGGEGMICSAATCRRAFQEAAETDDVAIDLLELACRAFGI